MDGGGPGASASVFFEAKCSDLQFCVVETTREHCYGFIHRNPLSCYLLFFGCCRRRWTTTGVSSRPTSLDKVADARASSDNNDVSPYQQKQFLSAAQIAGWCNRDSKFFTLLVPVHDHRVNISYPCWWCQSSCRYCCWSSACRSIPSIVFYNFQFLGGIT